MVTAWGGSPTNHAIDGLRALLRRADWKNSTERIKVRSALLPVLESPNVEARMLVSGAIANLFDSPESRDSAHLAPSS